jgi:MoxR-like ATPase
MRLSVGYPEQEDERQIIKSQQKAHPIESLEPVVNGDDLLSFGQQVSEVHVEASLEDYILQIIQATRSHADLALGASPRGSLALYKTSQALAAVQGRDYVIPDDIKTLVPLTLAHRMILKPESQLRGRTTLLVLNDILERTELPLETKIN